MRTTIINTVVAFALSIAFALSSNAESNNPLKNVNSSGVISHYVEAIAFGNVDYNKHLFTEDFEYRNDVNKSKFNRKDYVNFLNKNKGLKYNCNTTYQILDQTNNTCVAKTVMNFETFTRIDYVTLIQNDGIWKISKVVTTYP